jgi:DNA helicase-2/ATP-dependent DNA helicase PcrA
MPGMGPANAKKALDYFIANNYQWNSFEKFEPPLDARMAWKKFHETFTQLGEPNREWRGQVNLAREWYKPQMERLYEHVHMRIGDLDQLELLSSQYPSRERFLTELTLDPPQATSDLAGQAVSDEDYLVISTVHSAKGMEWDNVYIMNVVDGSFPNEFANKAELVEEERRLLYVAMTRARNELTFIVPLRFQITSQPKTSDGHVYGGRSRFLTEKLIKCFDESSFQGTNVDVKIEATAADSGTIDVASRLKQMW